MGRHLGLALAASLLAMAGLALVVDAEGAGCTTDNDCKGGRACVAGECTTLSAPTCGTDKDCPGEQICAGGSCVAAGGPAASAAPPGSASPPDGAQLPPVDAPPAGSAPPAGTTPPPGAMPPPGYGTPPPGYPVAPPGYGTPQSGPGSLGYGSLGYGPPLPPPPEKRYNNKALMITGAVLLPVGFVAGVAGGAAMAVLEETQRRGLTDDQMGLVALPIVGGTFVVTGIVFLAVGAPKVPVNPDEQSIPAGPTSPPPPVAVEPMIGPGSFGLSGTF